KTIKYIVNLLDLNVTLIKVKGHSSDFYNNIADDLARLRTQSPMNSINYLQVSSLNLLFQFDGIIIESLARHLIKNIFAAIAVSNIIDLHKNADLKSLT
ncbi:17290_t:CDS:1, partial [Funneliformis geosporum]